MARKPAAKKKSSKKKSSKKKFSLQDIRKAIKRLKKKLAKVKTPAAKALDAKLTRLDTTIPCGQGLFVDIS
jgi:hypothetical protein